LFLFDARRHLNAGSAHPRVSRSELGARDPTDVPTTVQARDSLRPRVRRARHTLRVNQPRAGYNIKEGGSDICQM